MHGRHPQARPTIRPFDLATTCAVALSGKTPVQGHALRCAGRGRRHQRRHGRRATDRRRHVGHRDRPARRRARFHPGVHRAASIRDRHAAREARPSDRQNAGRTHLAPLAARGRRPARSDPPAGHRGGLRRQDVALSRGQCSGCGRPAGRGHGAPPRRIRSPPAFRPCRPRRVRHPGPYRPSQLPQYRSQPAAPRCGLSADGTGARRALLRACRSPCRRTARQRRHRSHRPGDDPRAARGVRHRLRAAERRSPQGPSDRHDMGHRHAPPAARPVGRDTASSGRLPIPISTCASGRKAGSSAAAKTRPSATPTNAMRSARRSSPRSKPSWPSSCPMSTRAPTMAGAGISAPPPPARRRSGRCRA